MGILRYSRGGSGSFPTAIYLEADGAIRNVRVARYKGPFLILSCFQQMFKKNVVCTLGTLDLMEE